MATQSERIARLEGIVEEIRNRLNDMTSRINSIEVRLNAIIILILMAWITTLIAIFIKG